MKPTHDICWEFDAHKADGTLHTFTYSVAVNLEEWDNDAREAAIFYTFDEKDALAEDGWHIDEPSTIQVYRVSKLSDIDLF